MTKAPVNAARERHRSEKVGDYVSIYRRGATWWIQYTPPDGHQVRRSLKTSSKKQAKLLALKVEGQILQGVSTEKICVATIDEAITSYVESLVGENRSKKTLSKYRLVFRRVAELARSRKAGDLRGVTLQFCDAYRKARRDTGAAPKSIHTEMTIIRQLVNFALSRGMVEKDRLGCLNLKRPKPTPQPCWTPEEVERILGALEGDPYWPVYSLLSQTGLRIGEAKHLTWNDIDLKNGVLHVRSKVVDEETSETWKPKNGDQRTVPLSRRAVKMLRSQPQTARWVFVSPSTKPRLLGQRIDERRVLAHLKAALQKLGLPGHTHTFRHAFISRSLLGGVPESVVRTWVGHVDAQILGLYTHIADRDSKAFMDRLSGRETVKAS